MSVNHKIKKVWPNTLKKQSESGEWLTQQAFQCSIEELCFHIYHVSTRRLPVTLR